MARAARSLNGKVVAITGGARGIGKATAKALVRKGAKVAIGDLDRELAEQTAAELGATRSRLELDVTRRDSFEGFLDQVEERLGSLDVLVNNAGIMPLGRFVDEDDLTARRMVDINVHGVMYGMKLALAADAAPRHAATSSTSPRRRARAASRAAPPTAAPSTSSSASPRRCAPSFAARTSRSPA